MLQTVLSSLSILLMSGQDIINFISGNTVIIIIFITVMVGLGYIIKRLVQGEHLSDILGFNPQHLVEIIVFITSIIEIVSMANVVGDKGGNQMLALLRYSPIVILEVILSFYALKTLAEIIADLKVTWEEAWDVVLAAFSFLGAYACTRLLLWLYYHSIGAVTFTIGTSLLWGFIPNFSSQAVVDINPDPLIVFGILCTPVFNGLAFLFMIKDKMFSKKSKDTNINKKNTSTKQLDTKKEKSESVKNMFERMNKGKTITGENPTVVVKTKAQQGVIDAAKEHIKIQEDKLNSSTTNEATKNMIRMNLASKKEELKVLEGKK